MSSRRVVAGAVVALCLMIVRAEGATPGVINFQGYIADDASGTPLNGTMSVDFTIYGDASAGTALWTETKTVTFTDGYYAVALGSDTPIPGTVFDDATIYLEVELSGSELFTPRIQLMCVPFARAADVADTAGDAQTLNGHADTYFATSAHTHTLAEGATDVTATAAELNILDGVTAIAAELNILDGVTATAAELNLLAGETGDVLTTDDTVDADTLEGNSASDLQPALVHTIVVSDATGLNNAVTAINTAGPTSAQHWLIKLEPGTYDLGSGYLHLPHYTDVEGSGRLSTTIVSTQSGSTVRLGTSCELRHLTVRNDRTDNTARCISAGANSVITDVVMYIATGGATTVGIYAPTGSGTITVRDSVIDIDGGTTDTYGLYSVSDPIDFDVSDTKISISGAAGSWARGISITGATGLNVRDCIIDVDADCTGAHGMYLGTITNETFVTSCRIAVDAGTGSGAGIRLGGSLTTTARNCQIDAKGDAGEESVYVGGGYAILLNSRLTAGQFGSADSVNVNSGGARVVGCGVQALSSSAHNNTNTNCHSVLNFTPVADSVTF